MLLHVALGQRKMFEDAISFIHHHHLFLIRLFCLSYLPNYTGLKIYKTFQPGINLTCICQVVMMNEFLY